MSNRRLHLADFRDDASDEEEEDAFTQLIPKKHIELSSLSDIKQQAFSHGVTKKSKRDLEREAEERKRKEEEEALAKVNAELEDSFNAPGGMYAYGPGGAGRGMGMGRGRGMGGGFVRAGGAGYVPPSQAGTPGSGGSAPAGPSSGWAPPTGPSKMPPAGPAAMGYARPGRPKSPSPPRTGAKKGKRAMDSFLQEIKSNQEARENRFGNLAKEEGLSVTALAAWEHNPAARKQQAQNPVESTNVMIYNLPASVTEESLGKFFARCGPVGTVKIMWPRGVAEIQAARSGRASLMGFVNFMKRDGAAKAINELDQVSWGGAFLRLQWGQPMPLPQKAIYGVEEEPTRHRARSRSPEKEQTGSGSVRRSDTLEQAEYRDHWLGKVPPEREAFVRSTAQRVKEYGKAFEDGMKQREKGNVAFAFLHNAELPEYHLFKYIIDPDHHFPPPTISASAPEEVVFDDSGYASCYSTDSGEASERERGPKGKLGRRAQRRFEALLRALSGRRAEIARGMEFALRHADAADEVADLICASCTVADTPVPRKLARLHLISDILHNSASPLPNVWRYRMAFEKRLVSVMGHFAGVHQSLLAYSGQIAADVFRGQVGAVLAIWEGWIVLAPETSATLRQLLDGETTLDAIEAEARAVREVAAKKDADDEHKERKRKQEDVELGKGRGFKSSGFKSSFKRVGDLEKEAEELLAEALMEGGQGADQEDLDGEEMEDLDGEEMRDGDGDVDGEPMGGDDEDLDGEAMEGEGRAGAAMSTRGGGGDNGLDGMVDTQGPSGARRGPAFSDDEESMDLDEDEDLDGKPL